MQIRAAEPGDAEGIWTVLEPVFRSGETYAIDQDISRDDALTYWSAEQCFVAVEGRAVLGTYYIKRNQKGGGSHICNCGYVTGRQAQGKGVARAMLAHSLEAAKEAGFLAMQFNFVLANNLRALATWEKAGFAQIGRIPQAFQHPKDGFVDAVILHKKLS